MTKYIFLISHNIEVFIFQVRKQVQEHSYLFGITGHKAASYACAFAALLSFGAPFFSPPFQRPLPLNTQSCA